MSLSIRRKDEQMRYKLTRPQIRRLIAGECLKDGHGMTYKVSEKIKARLKEIDENNLYVKADIYLDDVTGIELYWKEYPAELKGMEEKR